MVRKAQPGSLQEIRTKVRGVTFRNPGRLETRQVPIKKFVRKGTRLEARREPSDEHPNTIGLWVKARGVFYEDEYRIGYIASDLFKRLAPLMDDGTEIQVIVIGVTGGTENKPRRGVNTVASYREPMPPGTAIETLDEWQDISTKIRGVRHDDPRSRMDRQVLIKKYVRKGMTLVAIREPQNRYDMNAIRVWVYAKGILGHKRYQIGYLSRDLAGRLAPLVDSGAELDITVWDVTGRAKSKSLGLNVMLHCHEPGEPAAEE